MSRLLVDSNGKPAALFVTPEAPYPVAGGGALRSASVLEYLARRYVVDVIVFREEGKPDPLPAFPAGLARNVWTVDLPFHSQDSVARVVRNARRLARSTPPLVDRYSGFEPRIAEILQGRSYALAVLEHFWCATYVSLLRRHASRVVLDLHNVESVLLARCANAEGLLTGTALKRFASACRQLETELLPQFSALLVCSEADAVAAQVFAPDVETILFPNSIPLQCLPQRAKTDSIVFSGNMRYAPNLSAVRFFHRSIWPIIRARWPQLRWNLVGRDAEHLPAGVISDERVEVIGAVEDAVTELASHRVAVAPLLAGSGTRLKIIEAWAAGVPVVSTSLGAEGLPAHHRENLLIADTPDQFADAVSAILSSKDLGDHLAGNGRQVYESSLNWTVAWEHLRAAGF